MRLEKASNRMDEIAGENFFDDPDDDDDIEVVECEAQPEDANDKEVIDE